MKELERDPAKETVDRFEKEFNEIEINLSNVIARIQDTKLKIAELDSNMQALQLAGDVPSESDLGGARGYREDTWNLVKQAWIEGVEKPGGSDELADDARLANVYEESVRIADDIADRLRREADRVAQKATWNAERDQHLKALAEFDVQQQSITDQKDILQGEWKALWSPQGIEPLRPMEMRGWILKYDELVRMAETVRRYRAKSTLLTTKIVDLKKTICLVLESLVSIDVLKELNLVQLIAKCLSVIDSADQANNARASVQNTVKELRQQLIEAEAEEKDALEGLGLWENDWKTVLMGLPSIFQDDPASVNALLETADKIIRKIDDASLLKHRVDSILDDGKSFVQDVRSLVLCASSDLESMPADHAVSELNARLKESRENAAVRAQLLDHRTNEENELREEQRIQAEMRDRLEALRKTAKCEREDDVEKALAASDEARNLKNRIIQLESQLLSFTGGASIHDFLTEASQVDADGLQGRISELSELINEAESQISQLDQTIGSERTEIAKMDGNSKAAEAAEKAQAALAQIRDKGEHYIRLRLAAAILRAEMERYRKTNQAPVVTRASELFSSMTLGSFTGISADYDEEDRPILVGVRPTGEEITVEGMSEGTCDQLYLSLRLASLEGYLAVNEPLPFIVDDILVNFDDDRARATLKVLAELSSRTQVMFFTHHRHLVELATAVVPDGALFVHSL